MGASQEVYTKILGYLQRKQYQEAERVCLFELDRLGEKDGQLLLLLGTAARMLGKNQASLIAFNAALSTDPDHIDYLQACASAYEALGNLDEAYQLMSRVVEIAPDHANARANLAVALQRLGRIDEALNNYETVLQVEPLQRTANLNYGTLLLEKGRKHEALSHCRRAYEKLSHEFGTLYNLVSALIANFKYQEALDYCDQGLGVQPKHAHLLMKKAVALSGLSRRDEALAMMSRARIIQPSVIHDFIPDSKHLPSEITLYLDGEILEHEARYTEQQDCYWRYRDIYINELRAGANDKPYKSPALSGIENGFRLLSLDVSAADRLALMRNISDKVADYAWRFAVPDFKFPDRVPQRIRVGYLSPDFRQHATSVLTRQIYQLHDRSEFEIYAYSLHNGAAEDRYRQEIEVAVDMFYDVAGKSAVDVAKLIHRDGIDILVDLAGYSKFSNPFVMALRPAPVQIHYLGIAGTLGADFIDYILVDRTVCADGQQNEWHEKVIRLPHSYFPYDNEIENSPTTVTRADCGLPEDAFVFCCFNNSYKIEPLIFNSWARILKSVPDSVLWLLGKDTDIQHNLEREAESRGIGKSRLVFAERLPMSQHLPRYQLADLFLDTYWHNAHTTAAEALWQGLPLLTIHGEVPSARGSSSILHALEMSELVVRDFDEYEQRAAFYATHQAEYHAIREKLRVKRYTAPMYNTKLSVRHIERAYHIAWERHLAGLPPAPIDVLEIEEPDLRKSIH
jgi:protein O-GlcNAc transferase